MADSNNDGTNTLFFIVGGLVVLAVIFGMFVWTPRDNAPADIAPAAGDSYSSSTTETETERNTADPLTGTITNESSTTRETTTQD